MIDWDKIPEDENPMDDAPMTTRKENEDDEHTVFDGGSVHEIL